MTRTKCSSAIASNCSRIRNHGLEYKRDAGSLIFLLFPQPATHARIHRTIHPHHIHTHIHTAQSALTLPRGQWVGCCWGGGEGLYSPALHSPSISCVRLLDAFDGGWCELLGLHGGHARARTKHTDRQTDRRPTLWTHTHTRALVADANCWTGFLDFSFQQ